MKVLFPALKRFGIGPFEFLMYILVVLATLLRVILISFNWPITNSDEANMGLLAMHIAYNGEWPIFFYGMPYMGPLEGYFAAPLFHIFGPTLFALRLALLPFFALFLVGMYYLTRLLYSRGLALFIVLVFSFGSPEFISRQVKAVGEYPETALFAALIALFAAWLALTAYAYYQQPAAREKRRRLFIYGLLGLVIGLSLWVDFLILPFVTTALVLLFLFCWREIRSWAGLTLLVGIIIGMFPLLLYNVTAPLERNSINVLMDIHRAGEEVIGPAGKPWLQQIVGAILIALPNAMGASPICRVEAFPLFGTAETLSIPCIIWHGIWGIGFIVLGVVATVLAVRSLWQLRTDRANWNEEKQRTLVFQSIQLMLLISAGGTLVLYMMSPSAALFPQPTARYLICMIVVIPTGLWVLWKNIPFFVGRRLIGPGAANSWGDYTASDKLSTPRLDKSSPYEAMQRPKGRLDKSLSHEGMRHLKGGIGAVSSLMVCLLVLIFYIQGFTRTIDEVSAAQGYYNRDEALVNLLIQQGQTRIYSEYWTCNRLTFQSRERVICSSLNDELGPGFDRYTPYGTIVRSAENPAYVFPQGSPQIAIFEQKAAQQQIQYQRNVFDNYVILQPASKLPPIRRAAIDRARLRISPNS